MFIKLTHDRGCLRLINSEDFVDLKKIIDLYNKLDDMIIAVIPDISEEQTMNFIIDCVKNEVINMQQEEPK